MSQPLDPDRSDSARLRQALAELAAHEPQQEPCPTPDALWTAVTGEAPRDQRLEVVEHTVGCAHCAEAWRIARSMAEDADLQSVEGRSASENQAKAIADQAADPAIADNVTPFRSPPSSHGSTQGSTRRSEGAPRRPSPAWMAVAASLVAALGLGGVGWWIHRPPGAASSEPVFRETGPLLVEPLVEDGATLPRDALTLRWRGPEGARYRVTLATESLDVVFSRGGLTESELSVPPETLSRLPEESLLLWTLEASLIDGGTVTVPTRVLHLDGPPDASEKKSEEK